MTLLPPFHLQLIELIGSPPSTLNYTTDYSPLLPCKQYAQSSPPPPLTPYFIQEINNGWSLIRIKQLRHNTRTCTEA